MNDKSMPVIGRSRRSKEKKPDERGNISVTTTLIMKEDLYKFLLAQTEKESRSISTMAVMQLKKYKETCERLGI